MDFADLLAEYKIRRGGGGDLIQKHSDLTMINAGCEIPVAVGEYVT
jgi:hypothetical protein